VAGAVLGAPLIKLVAVGIFVASTLLTAAIGYLIGSVPSAYLVMRRHAGLDLRQHGTGNIGAANAYDVSGKRSVGMTVMSIDMLKGLLPVLVCELFGLYDPLLVLMPALVLGHCYPVWLRFRGGRGLATTAGALMLVHPLAVLIWCIAYVTVNRIRRDTHIAATFAVCICMLLLLVIDERWISATTLPISGLNERPTQLASSILILLVIVLSRYIRPFLVAVRRSAE
jgi:glycerol-3-phosphate acyltransferase PlsY